MTDDRVHLTKVRPGDVLLDDDGLHWNVASKGPDLWLRNVAGRSRRLTADKDGFLIGLKRPPLEYDV